MKICIVCSPGGHLTETLQIFDAIQDYDIFFATSPSSRDAEVKAFANAYFIDNIGTSIFRMVRTFFWALRILYREKPNVILSLGAEIAIPFFYIGKILGIKTIFSESWCRVEGLSFTGKLVYPVVDQFWVQWPQLLEVCGPKAQYHGAVI